MLLSDSSREGEQGKGGPGRVETSSSPLVTQPPFSASLASKLTHLNQHVFFHSLVFFLDRRKCHKL